MYIFLAVLETSLHLFVFIVRQAFYLEFNTNTGLLRPYVLLKLPFSPAHIEWTLLQAMAIVGFRTKCRSATGLIVVFGIFLSLVAVSWEGYLWSIWETVSSVKRKTRPPALEQHNTQSGAAGMALAMPMPQDKDDGERDNDDEDAGHPDDFVEVENKEKSSSEQSAENGKEVPPFHEERKSDDGQSSSQDNNTQVAGSNIADSGRYEGFKSVRRVRSKSFLMVFNGHSGSTAFITELRAHSELDIEAFEPMDHGEYKNDTDLALKRAHELMDRGIAKGKIPGFKMRPFHIHNKPDMWREFVKKYDSRIVWQYRENIVKQAVGEYRHQYLNDSSVVKGLEMNQVPCAHGSDQICRFKIDDMAFLHRIMNSASKNDDRLAAAARILRRSEDMLIVRYEDYLYEKERTMRETFDFFGIDYEETSAERQKASPDSLCDMVINFQDVCNHFHPCSLWRPYLTDTANNCRCEPGDWEKFDPTYCRRVVWEEARQ